MVLAITTAIIGLMMFAQYSYDIVTNIYVGNIMIIFIFACQISALKLQCAVWSKQKLNKNIKFKTFLYGFACGFWGSFCFAYSEGLSVAMVSCVHVVNFIVVSAFTGSICVLVASFMSKRGNK